MTEKDEKILNAQLDDEELDQVSGGFCIFFGADGKGGCTQDYYKEKCDATVESASHCHRHDFCNTGTDIHYEKAPQTCGSCGDHAD